MNTARLTRYDVSASLSASGGSPTSAAIAGSEVVITVESMFSMNSAQATISGTRTARRILPSATFAACPCGPGATGREVVRQLSDAQPQRLEPAARRGRLQGNPGRYCCEQVQ